jgi:hypothetical protein
MDHQNVLFFFTVAGLVMCCQHCKCWRQNESRASRARYMQSLSGKMSSAFPLIKITSTKTLLPGPRNRILKLTALIYHDFFD